jgi:hypothetical protein
LLDADADRADLELRLSKLSLKDRARVHPFAGKGRSWRKAVIPFEIVSTSDKKVAGNGMRMRAIADSGPGNRAPPIYSRGLRQPLPSMTRLAPARSSQT